jgi:aminoglycoside phosphotransferase (APT) family kinase protein
MAQPMMNTQPDEVIKRLTGQSGCAVELCRRDAFYFVRKTSASFDYNARLMQQMEKQIGLRSLIPVPDVIGHGTVNGLAYYEMDYVSGHDFGTYCTQEKLAAINNLSEGIVDVFSSFAVTGEGMLDEEKFSKKIESVTAAIRAHPDYDDHAEILDWICGLLADASWSTIPSTSCHGDFTLENIIFRAEGRLIFVDLLDGELDSFWMDMAKFMHDLETGWSLRRILWNGTPSQEARFLSMLSRYLAEELASRIDTAFPDAIPYMRQMRMLQAMRVLPYVKDSRIFAQIVDGLRKLLAQG